MDSCTSARLPIAITSLVLVAVLFAPRGSGADLFDLQRAQRVVFAEGTSFCPGCGPNGEDETTTNGDEEESLDFGSFDAAVSSVGSDAYQISFLGPGRISGFGGISVGFTGDNTARSLLIVDFFVPVTQTYTLHGNIGGSSPVSIRVGDALGILVERESGAFVDSFTLESGRLYRLSATVSDDGFGIPAGGEWSFLLVPEPSSWVLMGLGVAAILAGRRLRAGVA